MEMCKITSSKVFFQTYVSRLNPLSLQVIFFFSKWSRPGFYQSRLGRRGSSTAFSFRSRIRISYDRVRHFLCFVYYSSPPSRSVYLHVHTVHPSFTL